MVTRLQAYCGLDCGSCPAYVAKRTDDDALRAKTASEWTGPDFPIQPDEVNCDGCATAEGTRWKFCQACHVRGCASARHVATCADCPDYACHKLTHLLDTLNPQARSNLEALRAEA